MIAGKLMLPVTQQQGDQGLPLLRLLDQQQQECIGSVAAAASCYKVKFKV